MKNFEQLKEKTTPEFIKKLVKLADGFKCNDDTIFLGDRNIMADFDFIFETSSMFSLLLHRAVEGYAKRNFYVIGIYMLAGFVSYFDEENEIIFKFSDYQPCHLTPCEMAIWDCLLEVLK